MMQRDLVTLETEGHQLVALAENRANPGTPIVFLHGITASIQWWPASLPESVVASVPWYSLSLPAHFPAKAPAAFDEASVTPEMFASVLGSAIQQLVGDRPVRLVGHSTGAFAALILASLRPQQVESVLCISGFAQGRWTGLFGFLQTLALKGPLGKNLFKLILRFSTSNARRYRIGSLFNAADRKAYLKSPVLESTLEPMRLDAAQHNLEHLRCLFAEIARMDIEPLLSRIQAPVTVVAGDCDPLVPLEQAHRIHQATPNAELILWPQIGHMFVAECTETYQQLLTNWLQSGQAALLSN